MSVIKGILRDVIVKDPSRLKRRVYLIARQNDNTMSNDCSIDAEEREIVKYRAPAWSWCRNISKND